MLLFVILTTLLTTSVFSYFVFIEYHVLITLIALLLPIALLSSNLLIYSNLYLVVNSYWSYCLLALYISSIKVISLSPIIYAYKLVIYDTYTSVLFMIIT